MWDSSTVEPRPALCESVVVIEGEPRPCGVRALGRCNARCNKALCMSHGARAGECRECATRRIEQQAKGRADQQAKAHADQQANERRARLNEERARADAERDARERAARREREAQERAERDERERPAREQRERAERAAFWAQQPSLPVMEGSSRGVNVHRLLRYFVQETVHCKDYSQQGEPERATVLCRGEDGELYESSSGYLYFASRELFNRSEDGWEPLIGWPRPWRRCSRTSQACLKHADARWRRLDRT
jgi:hypothetical protein